jgi:HPt (histidine-containing phosphotransfer) domain-containing protein
MANSTGLRIASYFRSSSEIGGDIWGMLPINDSSFGIFIADFTGHGVTAALNTFRLHALIHEYRHLHGDPRAFLAALNKRLAALLRLGQFATFLYVVIDHVAGRLRIASAGASPPILMAGLRGSSQLVEASGAPLGIAPDMQYLVHERPFAPGARLLLYSDGLPENPDRDGNRIGETGLIEAIDACAAGLTPQQLVGRICQAAGIEASRALPDDTTVICVDRRGPLPFVMSNAGGNLSPRSKPPSADETEAAHEHHAAEFTNAPLLDPEQIELLRQAMGPEDLGAMLAELPQHALQSLDAIKAALAADDRDQTRRAAHVLKGFAGSFGAARLAAVARDMELECPSVKALRQCMPALVETIEATAAAIDELTSVAGIGS